MHGQKVSKSNFLSVYAHAHKRALTAKNIRVAFKKTGVYPVDPSVITNDMLAPAHKTAIDHHAIIPLQTPVRVLVSAFTKLEQQRRDTQNAREQGGAISENDSEEQVTDLNVPNVLISVFTHLSKTSKHPLFTDKPLGSHTSPPHFNTNMISPIKRCSNLLQVEPLTECEKLLQQAL